MKMFYTLLIVGIGILLLLTANSIIRLFQFQIHANSFIDGMIKYQLFAFVVGVLVCFIICFWNPSAKKFLSVGELEVSAVKENWLGINGKTSWLLNGFQLLFFISAGTALFMFLAVYTSNHGYFQWSFIPFIVVFSLSNSLMEELIFRFALVGGLYEHYSKNTILIISAVLFGFPHYFGFPSGIIGVIMSSILGYILTKATFETKGLTIAWSIHFVQDVIIFTALIIMNVN